MEHLATHFLFITSSSSLFPTESRFVLVHSEISSFRSTSLFCASVIRTLALMSQSLFLHFLFPSYNISLLLHLYFSTNSRIVFLHSFPHFVLRHYVYFCYLHSCSLFFKLFSPFLPPSYILSLLLLLYFPLLTQASHPIHSFIKFYLVLPEEFTLLIYPPFLIPFPFISPPSAVSHPYILLLSILFICSLSFSYKKKKKKNTCYLIYP